MEIDTGSAVSIISESVYKKIIFETQTSEILQQTEAKLRTYSDEQLPVKGKLTCEVSYEGHTYTLGEMTAACGAELRALSEYCNFGDTLELMLCDRLVCGVNEPQMFTAEDKLTFKKPKEISLAFEAAMKNTKQLQTAISASSVVGKTEKPSPNIICRL